MARSPTVAVVIPAYNCAEFIVETLESLAVQTSLPDEVIVVDDGSTDDTAALVERFAQSASLPVTLVRQPNGGIAAARNAAVSRSSADLIALLDGDDTYYPEFIERAKRALVAHPAFILCFSDRDVVTGDGRFIRRDLDEPKFRAMPAGVLQDGVSTLNLDPFLTLVSGNVIPIGNLMLRRKAFDAVGGFDPDLRAVEDKPFLMRLSRLGPFAFIDEPLGTWRRHTTNTSGSGNAFKMNWYSEIGLRKLAEQADALGLTQSQRDAVERERDLMPARLLYSASAAADPAYPRLAVELFRTSRVTLPAVALSSARFAWRYLGRNHA